MMFKARKVGDLYPCDLYLQANGVAISDVSTSLGFYVTLVNKATRAPKVVTYPISVVDAPTALLRWTPTASQVDTAAVYLVEIKQIRSDGTARHFPSGGYSELQIVDVLS